MSNPKDLVTPADVKLWCAFADVSDTKLQAMITGLSVGIDNYLNRTILSTVYTGEVYQGFGSDTLILRQWPVTLLSAVSVMGTPVDVSKFMIAANGRQLIFLDDCFPVSRAAAKVTYTAGYASPPEDLKEACLIWVAELLKQGERPGMVSKGLANETTTYERLAMPAVVKGILGNFKNVIPQ